MYGNIFYFPFFIHTAASFHLYNVHTINEMKLNETEKTMRTETKYQQLIDLGFTTFSHDLKFLKIFVFLFKEVRVILV